jgi:hypothetical protein
MTIPIITAAATATAMQLPMMMTWVLESPENGRSPVEEASPVESILEGDCAGGDVLGDAMGDAMGDAPGGLDGAFSPTELRLLEESFSPAIVNACPCAAAQISMLKRIARTCLGIRK